MHFLVCYEQLEKCTKDECTCVSYLELSDPANFRKELKEFSACPEKVDELIVDIDSE